MAARAADVERLGFELSFAALQQQERSLDELRGRTGTLLAASSLAASFLGSRSAGNGAQGMAGWLALGAFTASVLAALYILLPKPQLIFAFRGTLLIEEIYAIEEDVTEALRRAAYWIEGYRDANQPRIDRLFVGFRIAAIAVLLEVALWSVELMR